MNEVACLVACSDSKLDSRQPAWKIYDSVTYEKSMAAAMAIGQPYVMSAKHNLLHLGERVDPYDETLKDKDKESQTKWAMSILRPLPERYTDIVMFGGRDYVDPLKRAHEGDFYTRTANTTLHDPFQNTVGNGQQSSVAEAMMRTALKGGSLEDVLSEAP